MRSLSSNNKNKILSGIHPFLINKRPTNQTETPKQNKTPKKPPQNKEKNPTKLKPKQIPLFGEKSPWRDFSTLKEDKSRDCNYLYWIFNGKLISSTVWLLVPFLALNIYTSSPELPVASDHTHPFLHSFLHRQPSPQFSGCTHTAVRHVLPHIMVVIYGKRPRACFS